MLCHRRNKGKVKDETVIYGAKTRDSNIKEKRLDVNGMGNVVTLGCKTGSKTVTD